uniref:Peptidase S1 domain-containing protein n=1 Tax=Megaselia scalaris TaxID=36166 RepID=T1GZN2_MEGSC
MQKVDVPVVPRETCITTLRGTSLGLNFELHESLICAGGEAGKDTCIVDRGSPLVCTIPGSKDRYYQAGIFAWGIGCNNPAAYISVSYM